jgi:hypothetical protein
MLESVESLQQKIDALILRRRDMTVEIQKLRDKLKTCNKYSSLNVDNEINLCLVCVSTYDAEIRRLLDIIANHPK